MNVTITPSSVRGMARAPPSKSYTHRAILAAGYADGATVRDALWSADTQATARAVELFGGTVDRHGDGSDTLEIDGFGGRPDVPANVIDCANSGTTIRLVTAAAALADGTSVLTGDGSLRSRPQGPLLEALADLGARADSTRGNGQAPLVVTGPLTGGDVSIPGDVSSQYITALLLAGAVTDEGISIELETELKSAPYVDITLEVLDDFGVEARKTDAGFAVDGGQSYAPAGGDYAVPGDFSSISYPLAAGAIAGTEGVRIEGAHPSAQGDTAIVDIVERMGADVEWDRDAGTIDVSTAPLSGIEVEVENTPDLLPTIATLGAVAEGDTHITNAEHVRYKETDRVSAMAEELGKMGVETTEERDSLTVHGGDSSLSGATVSGRDDHRIIMALALAGLVADGETTIEGADHVDVSFPGFFGMLEELGVGLERDGRQ
ncbi:3-phosphoshikimate 1-carboxyvinyltransferase [Natrinema sp. H-ect4]|uniref:3-phosphoshikimate 1-carboxyvinyltransferase n=1 Tax=Natrinema sp. H-ect4 TaxID=3242699 RepID=UPI0035A8FFCD